jgi:hypothetical protein
VYLDEKVKVTQIVVTANGRVATHDLLAFNLCRNGDVLSNWETEYILLVRQRETVTGVNEVRSEVYTWS